MLDQEPRIGCFATLLPNRLLSGDDLRKRNRVDSLESSALARHGLDATAGAIRQLERMIERDTNHFFAARMLDWINLSNMIVAEGVKVSPAS
jgi:hypothetical protein